MGKEISMIGHPITIYKNKEDGRILIQPKMGNAVIYDDGQVLVLGAGIISMNWYHDKEEKKKWKKLVEVK